MSWDVDYSVCDCCGRRFYGSEPEICGNCGNETHFTTKWVHNWGDFEEEGSP